MIVGGLDVEVDSRWWLLWAIVLTAARCAAVVGPIEFALVGCTVNRIGLLAALWLAAGSRLVVSSVRWLWCDLFRCTYLVDTIGCAAGPWVRFTRGEPAGWLLTSGGLPRRDWLPL